MNRQKVPQTRKWLAISRVFESLVKRGVSMSAFSLDMAHARGSTALHRAAQCGNTDLVMELLAMGAERSLEIRNAMGSTPLEVAKIFGPFPETESALVRGSLGRKFQLRIRDGAGR